MIRSAHRTRHTLLVSLALAALLGGCSAPPPAPDHPEAFMPALQDYLVGVWEVAELPGRLPWFLCSSSDDAFEVVFNPPGYHPLDVQPELLQLIVFPSWGDVWQRQGLLLVRVTVDGEPREFIRDYELKASETGAVRMVIASNHYALRVGPAQGEFALEPVAPHAEDPHLTLRYLDHLPHQHDPVEKRLPAGVARDTRP